MKIGWDIRTRVLVVALVPTLVLGLLLTALLTFSRLSDLEEALVQRGQALAKQLAAASEYGLFAGNRDALQQLANSTMVNADLQGIAILDHDGELMAVAGLQAHTSHLPQDRSQVEQVGGNMLRITEPVLYTSALEDDPYTETRGKPARTRQPTRLGEIVVLVSLEPLQARKHAQMLAAMLTLLVVLAGSGLLALLMSRSVSAPIRRIAHAVTEIGRGQLATRVPVERGGTLRRLTEGVNDMAARLSVARDDLEQRVEDATVELRARKEEAELANLAKSRFLAAASHDLRQPMHALGLFIADLARKDHVPANRLLIDRISASAEAMENLLDSLLDISKLDAGVVTANPRPFALGPLFERIAADYGPAASERGLQLRVRPTTAWIESDPLLFERILLNLIGNALRYTPRGCVMLAARRRGKRIRIEVRDSGLGIPEEQQEAVFQEFVQLDNPARDRSKGLGLGLAIVRRMVDLLGHTVTLRSAPNRGSVFAVEAAVASPVEMRDATTPLHMDLTGLVVAAIDDDSLAQQSLAGLLRAWGCFVIAADNVEQLIADMDDLEVKPDIVISDFRLPGELDGLQVIGAVRERYGARLPGLLLSGDTGPDTLRRATEYGIPLLHKPVRPARLRAAVTRLINDTGPDIISREV
ncbi:ATP-binding protein [Uliginosibacterium sp. sgz301328]|uniref:hybrid sensor histidine kinase/response regulator n=1 Tax=Uliginosibacterium sp. sgz301328 TaxID=3243764 RepID=UPI00359D456F